MGDVIQNAILNGTVQGITKQVGSSLVSGGGNVVKYIFKSGYDTAVAKGLIQSQLRKSTAKFNVASSIVDAIYVERPDLENSIRQYLLRPRIANTEDYGIVAGPKGIGKTTLVYHVTKNMTGIVVIKVSDRDTPDSIWVKLMKACGIEHEGVAVDDDLIYKAFEAECERDKNNPIKVVFEVERGNDSGNSQILTIVSSISKELTHFANVLVIVSEANATLGFTNDSGRQTIFWVDDMTAMEAHSFLTKGGISDDTITTMAVTLFQNSIGFQPLVLTNFCNFVRTLGLLVTTGNMEDIIKQFIRGIVADAGEELDKFDLYPILSELKKIPIDNYPNGVIKRTFVGQKYESVSLANPVDVFKRVKMSNAVMYHRASQQYRLVSKAHATALQNFNLPNVNNNNQ